MKKIISLTLALVMMFTLSMPCFAMGNAIPPEVYDFEGKLNFSYDVSGIGEEELPLFLEELKDVALDYSGTIIEKDPLAVQMYLDAKVTTESFNIPFKIWIDLDMTNIEDITYVITMELPSLLRAMDPILDKQYLVVDYSEMLDIGSDMYQEIYEGMQGTLEETQELVNTLAEQLFAGITEKRIASNHYRVSVSDEQAKEVIIKCIDLIMSTLTAMNEGIDDVSLEEAQAAIQEELPKVYKILRNVELFPGDGIVYEYKVDKNNYITYEKSNMNFKLDTAEWVKAISAEYPEMAEDAPETEIVFTAEFESETEYKNIGTAGPIEFPVTTEENSIDFVHMLMVQERESGYEPVKVYINNKYVYFPDAQPEVIEWRTMVPASVLFRELGGQMEYQVADDVAVVTGTLDGNTVELTIGSNTAYVNGEAVELDVAAFINKDDRTMVPIRFIAENFGLNVSYANNEYQASLEDYEVNYSEFMTYEEYEEFMASMQFFSRYDLMVNIDSNNF